MKKIALVILSGGLLVSAAIAHPVRGQTPPPPPPPPPYYTPAPPPPPGGNPTATPTVTPIPTATSTATPTATLTPTATATATAIPCFATVSLSHSTVKSGQKQKVTIKTLPSAIVKVVIKYPNNSKKTVNKTADANGSASYQYKQPNNKVTSRSQTVQISVSVTCSGQSPISRKKKYKIH